MMRPKTIEKEDKYPKELLKLLEDIKNKRLPQSLEKLRKLPKHKSQAIVQRIDECQEIIWDCIPISSLQYVSTVELLRNNQKLFYHGYNEDICKFELQLEKQARKSVQKFHRYQCNEVSAMMSKINDYCRKVELYKFCNNIK